MWEGRWQCVVWRVNGARIKPYGPVASVGTTASAPLRPGHMSPRAVPWRASVTVNRPVLRDNGGAVNR